LTWTFSLVNVMVELGMLTAFHFDGSVLRGYYLWAHCIICQLGGCPFPFPHCGWCKSSSQQIDIDWQVALGQVYWGYTLIQPINSSITFHNYHHFWVSIEVDSASLHGPSVTWFQLSSRMDINFNISNSFFRLKW
jgi:hypothetical protein